MPPDPKRLKALRTRLRRAIPEPRVELDFESPFQLLVATILAAQSTDVTINKITPRLFERYPTPAGLAAAEPEEVQEIIRSSGYFRNKQKAIMAVSQALVERHDGKVPEQMDALCALPGVARKTANVVLGSAFGINSGVIVDTHVGRVSQRLGLTEEKDPKKIEKDLMALLPKRSWIDDSHRLVLHGRYVCKSKDPACRDCPLAELCPAAEGEPKGRWGARADSERERVTG